ncbi:ergothioneine biosynthesis protein EgtC [Glycomyces halotolerans]
MCRHLAYLGPPRTLAEILIEPPHGLYEQSFAPRRQVHGRVNADGFGLGWWTGGATPSRYRRAVPIWADENLDDLAGQIRSGAMLGAVRDATTGSALDERAAAPFRAGERLFSHNGVVRDWRRLPEQIDTGLGVGELLAMEAMCDSALLWAMIAARLSVGQSTEAAIEAVVAEVARARPEARLNVLVMDRGAITAACWGDGLVYRQSDGSIRVASEPCDDVDGWSEVPQHHLLSATATAATVRPLSVAAQLET